MTSVRPPSFWTQRHAIELQKLAREAGKRVMHHRAASSENTAHKPDGSPVTAADHESQQILLEGLKTLTPDIPVVAEEKLNPAELAASGTYWLIDPLDGTRNYVAAGKEFSINIALLVDNEPCVGLIHAPALDELFYGDANGVLRSRACAQSFLDPHPPRSSGPPRLVASRHDAKRLKLDEWQKEGIIRSCRPCSSAYKFGLLASGEADLYPRIGETCEWDIAAGDALLIVLGGGIVTPTGETISYGKPEFLNGSFVAYGPTCSATQLEAFLKKI